MPEVDLANAVPECRNRPRRLCANGTSRPSRFHASRSGTCGTESACSWVKTSASSTSWSSSVNAAMTTSDWGWLACLHQRPTSIEAGAADGRQDGSPRLEQLVGAEETAVAVRCRLKRIFTARRTERELK